MTTPYTSVEIPRQGVNDDSVQVVEWLVPDGSRVADGQPLLVVETTKSAVDVDATASGFVFHLAGVGTDVPVGSVVAVIAPTAERPADLDGGPPGQAGAAGANGSGAVGLVTAKARAMMAEHGLPDEVFAGLEVVRTSDVEAYLSSRAAASTPAARRFAGEVLDPDADWDEVLSDERYRELTELLTRLRRRMKAKHDRHVATGDLLHDRWELAREYGFGEGTTVYDDCLVIGEVTIGHTSWVGPGCILDGSGGGLTIGHHVDVSAGCHLYTHNTIERSLTGHRAPIFHKPTTIGSCCFIGPNSVIAPGTVLGDHCFVAAGSYVEGTFGDNTFISGNPARQAGTVEVSGNRARVRSTRT